MINSHPVGTNLHRVRRPVGLLAKFRGLNAATNPVLVLHNDKVADGLIV